MHQKNTLGERLKIIRGHLTQAEFAVRIGVNANTLRAYEKGRNQPPADVLTAICREFGVNPAWLLMGDENFQPEIGVGGGVTHIDSAVKIVEDAIRASGSTINREQKMALAQIIREELKKKAAKLMDALS